jgi:glycosyltransferase involved in cell wall biosynthesis
LNKTKKTVVVLKGYPRLSETFIAQELLGLEKAGLSLEIVALRRPTDAHIHPVHREIKAAVRYLPEYLHAEGLRVFHGLLRSLTYRGFYPALQAFLIDLSHDRTRNRIRRFGQAMVLAAEWPEDAEWLHAHFIHTPASVTAYASIITGIPWTCSAHAKDIWTSPDWELTRKLAQARWVVTCTKTGFERLKELSRREKRVHLSYHGLDLQRFPQFKDGRAEFDGSVSENPVVIVSVGRAVEKKGYHILLNALALLRPKLAFRFVHIGGGEQLGSLKILCSSLGLDTYVEWKGALPQAEVLALYRKANIFALACRIADDGDRDGLPNVLVEACSQGLVCVSTYVSGVPELLTNDVNGLLVEPDHPQALADALERLIRDPNLRQRLGQAAEKSVRQQFDYHSSVHQLFDMFQQEWQKLP